MKKTKSNEFNRNYLLRITAAVVTAGIISSQIPSTSGVAFAQGGYLNPDDYVKKSEVLELNLKYTAVTLAAVGAMSLASTIIKAKAGAIASREAVTTPTAKTLAAPAEPASVAKGAKANPL